MKKWLFCLWAHKKYRCYPRVWEVNSNFWHCIKCHPCNEELQKFAVKEEENE